MYISISICIYLYLSVSIYQSIYLSICLSIYMAGFEALGKWSLHDPLMMFGFIRAQPRKSSRR